MEQAVRGTFDGRWLMYSELTHQHLSNIMWFNKLIWEDPDLDMYAVKEIKTRFNSKLLPYAPLHRFEGEIDILYAKGYITNKNESDVIVNGVWVGALKYEEGWNQRLSG